MKFATKLTFIVLGILLFFAVVVSSVVYRSNIKTLENQIKGRQIDTASHIMDKIDRMLFERFADIRVIASDPIVSSRDSTPKQIRKRLSEFRNYHKTYISLSLFDLNRVRIADTSGLDIGVQHPLSKYWENITKHKKFIMDVSESKSLGRTVIHFAFPVKDKSGEVFGIVISRVPISKLHHIVGNVGDPIAKNKEFEIDLIDKNGLLLYSTYNRKGILKDNLLKWKIVEDSIESQDPSFGIFTHGGIEDIHAFVHEQGYLDFEGNGWGLLVHVPTRIAFAPAVKLRNTIIIVSFVIFVLSAFFVFLISKTITRPIEELTRGTEIIGKGDLGYSVEAKTKDEIGQLAVSFNQMVNDLKKSNSALYESEEKYRALFEQSPCTIVFTDIKGNIEYVNPKFTQLTGYSSEEAIGQNLRILKTDKTSPEEYEGLWKNITSGKEWRGEFCNKKKSGELYWESASISPVKNCEDVITHFVAVKEDISERKRMEEELKALNESLEQRVVKRTEELNKSRKAHKIAQEIAHLGHWDRNTVDNTEVWSDEQCRIFGYEPGDIEPTYELFLKALHPHDYERVVTATKEALEGSTPYNIEYRIVRPDGTVRNIAAQGKVYLDTFGKPVRKIGTVLDITERKKAGEAILESEEKYRQITSTASDAIMVFDAETRQFVDVNKACEEIYGYTREEFFNMKHTEITAEVENSEKTIQETIAGKLYKIPLRYHRKKDGTVFPVEISASVFVHKGRMVLCGIIRDITERKRADETLLLHSEILENMNEGVNLVKASDGVIAFTNTQFNNLFGYEHGELVGKHVSVLNATVNVTPEKKAEEIIRELNDKESWSGEICNIKKDGTVFWCRANISAFNHPEFGEVWVAVHEDITKRKRTEEQVKASLKEKEVLLDEVHHRVKNNLQIISSLLDMSSMQTQNQETIELFAESRNRVESMALIHSQLYESERFDEIDMERHIQELSGNLLNIYSKEKTITIDIKSANVYLPVTQAVPCALVLNELISNSLKHAYKDGQQGIISISMQQLNDDTILAKVKDNGVGIPEEIDIERTKSLGLRLARNIVYKQLNGTMTVVRNNGTEFTVEFKLSKEGS